MAVSVFDDMWEAAQAMPEEQRQEFVYAVVRFGFEGAEPEGNPAWLPTFIAFRRRIEMSAEAKEKARKAANARWGNSEETADKPAETSNDAQASTEHDAKDMHEQNAKYKSKSKSKDINIVELPSANSTAIPYERIVGRLNEKAGTQYRHTTKKTRGLIRARFAEGFTERDFSDVIDSMCDRWRADPEMNRYLRPETLFGTKFEGYLQSSKQSPTNAARPRDMNSASDAELEAIIADYERKYGELA